MNPHFAGTGYYIMNNTGELTNRYETKEKAFESLRWKEKNLNFKGKVVLINILEIEVSEE